MPETVPPQITAPQTSPTQPAPNNPLNQLVPDGDAWLEIDDDGTPMGQWTWNANEEIWIFEQFVPNAALLVGIMPQTGIESRAIMFGQLIGVGTTGLLGIMILLSRKKKK
ncbi:MAG: hypothetical protein FWC71_11870 [Defluviitaleaceae bacterium]|nr:hypothetical protein [Defluviitaleaceae bacterium]